MRVEPISHCSHSSSIRFKLKEVMEKEGFSKSKLSRETGFRFETIQGYYLGNISRVDLFVLSEFCRVLHCTISDILEYIPSSVIDAEKEVASITTSSL